MKLSLSSHTKVLAVALVALSMALLAGGALQASNMGFKMNKVIQPSAPAGVGINWVSLPYRNPYQNAQDICNALGLTAPGKVELTRADIGEIASHTCGDVGPWAFTAARLRIGIEVSLQPVQVSGILVGSHAGGPPGVNIRQAGPEPLGRNDYPVLYHGTAANALNVCTDLGLDSVGPGVAHVQRNNGLGTIQDYDCGDAGPFALVLGEAVRITAQPVNLLGVVVPHF